MDTKTAIRSSLEAAGVRTFAFQATDAKDASTSSPFAVSSALSEDAETMDASVLMSSDYVQPLVSSDLTRLVDQLFDPDNAQWLRHCAVKKFIQWRRDYLKTSFDSHKRELRELALEPRAADTYSKPARAIAHSFQARACYGHNFTVRLRSPDRCPQSGW
jgi:hypothetical protein